MNKIENAHQLAVTMQKLKNLQETESNLVLTLASVRGLVNDLNMQINEYNRTKPG